MTEVLQRVEKSGGTQVITLIVNKDTGVVMQSNLAQSSVEMPAGPPGKIRRQHPGHSRCCANENTRRPESAMPHRQSQRFGCQ